MERAAAITSPVSHQHLLQQVVKILYWSKIPSQSCGTKAIFIGFSANHIWQLTSATTTAGCRRNTAIADQVAGASLHPPLWSRISVRVDD